MVAYLFILMQQASFEDSRRYMRKLTRVSLTSFQRRQEKGSPSNAFSIYTYDMIDLVYYKMRQHSPNSPFFPVIGV